MINYFNLIRALQTDQYDDFTVKELKEEFNTLPDIDTMPIVMLPEGLKESHGMSIMAYHVAAMHGNLIMVEGNPLTAHPAEPFPIKKIDIEPLTALTVAILNPKTSKHQKQQNNYRSRNFKK